MKKLTLATLALTLLPAVGFSAAFVGGQNFGAEDVEKGVHCQVKDVTLLAKSDADCTKAGGKVAQVKDAAEKK